MVDFAKPTQFEANYQLAFIDPSTGDGLGVLPASGFRDLNYSRIINDYGDFSCTIPGDSRYAQITNTLDLIVEIYRENLPGTGYSLEGTYLSRYYNVFEDENGQEWVIFGGYGLEHLLSRRIIRPEDDPNSAGGFVTYFGAADTLMRDLVLYQCVTPFSDNSRIMPGFTVNSVDGIGYTWFVRSSFDNLLDMLKEGALKGNIDFKVTRVTGASFIFSALRIGTNRTYDNNYPGAYTLFDPRRMNMFSPNLTVDRKQEKTFCYVLGQGIEDERFVFPVSVGASTDSPFNRIEVTTDARNSEDDDTDGLIAAGVDVLNDQARAISFEFEPDLAAPQGTYNSDWFLGDLVTASYKNYTINLRVMQINIEVSSGGQKVTPVLKNEQNI